MKAAAPTPAASPPRQPLRAGAAIALVNADALQAEILAATLRAAGMHVHHFSDAAESLRVFAQAPRPDLIILDLHMPEIDGWRLCRLIRSPAFAPVNSCPLLVTSNLYTGKDVEDISRDLGAGGFLSLPCLGEDLLRAVRAARGGAPHGARSRVLVVDDESAVRHLVTTGLTKAGFEVTGAVTTTEARAAFDTVRPAVVLLDHHLTEGHGMDLLPHFKRPGTAVVAIAMTGDLTPELAVDYARRGIDGFAYKPFTIKQLVAAIANAQRERALLRVEELLAERTRMLRRNDARLMQTARLASVGELASGIAHEINNPLFGVTSAAELLLETLPAEANNRDLAALIVKEGQRIATLVKRLLAFARQDESDLATHHPRDLVANTLTLVGTRLNKEGIRVHVNVPDELPSVIGRGTHLQQALMALLMRAATALNARYPKYNPDKIIMIRASASNEPAAHHVVLEIVDHGAGIPTDRLARLFQSPLATLESDCGLELSLAADIVARHGGHIDVTSELNACTSVKVALPADAGALAPQEAAS